MANEPCVCGEPDCPGFKKGSVTVVPGYALQPTDVHTVAAGPLVLEGDNGKHAFWGVSFNNEDSKVFVFDKSSIRMLIDVVDEMKKELAKND